MVAMVIMVHLFGYLWRWDHKKIKNLSKLGSKASLGEILSFIIGSEVKYETEQKASSQNYIHVNIKFRVFDESLC